MPLYKHYSFDLWLTLIKSNPLFKLERTAIFFERFNPQKKAIEEIGTIFRQVDLMCNSINEKAGKNIDAEEMYLMVISIIYGSAKFNDIDIDQLYDEMELLLFKHLPLIYNHETINVLEHLKQKGNCSISILSNTGFIKGRTLRQVLKRLEIDSFFDFQLYSDEVRMSKPNKDFFRLMLKNVKQKNKDAIFELKDIIHIGDNPNADIKGADSVSISSLLINSNNISISNLLC